MAKSHACSSPDHHVHDAAGFVAAVERACSERGLRLTEIRARVLGLEDKLGSIAVGRSADLVLLDDKVDVIQTWVAGESVYRKGEA